MRTNMDAGLSNNELVTRAQAGDSQAFETLVRRHRDRLEARIRSRMGTRLRAKLEPEDVVLETFRIALESIHKFRPRGEGSFFGWLASIAEHFLCSSSQKKAWDQIQLDVDVPGRDVSPSRSLRRHERFERLEKALQELPDDYRDVLRMARLEGLKIQEIAKRMQRSPDAVKKLLARATLSLKRSFGDTESLHLPDRRIGDGDVDHGE